MLAHKPIIDIVLCLTGQDISIYEESFLKRSVANRMKETAMPTIHSYIQCMQDQVGEVQKLLDSLLIDYSYFFRYSLVFGQLEHRVLPALVKDHVNPRRQTLRIWSAGCSAGQEAYSVAMLMEELNHSITIPFPYHIFGTDINDNSLKVAARGVYNTSSLQQVPLKFLENYYTRQDGLYTVIPEVRSRVEFSTYDLLDQRLKSPPSGIYGDFDLILCCNLLFYYTPAVRKTILEKLTKALSFNGFLVTGEAEGEIVAKTGLTPIEIKSTIFWKPDHQKRKNSEIKN